MTNIPRKIDTAKTSIVNEKGTLQSALGNYITHEHLQNLYDNNSNLTHIAHTNNRPDGLTETLTYYDPQVYGMRTEWQHKPDKPNSTFTNQQWLDCQCGKRLITTDYRKYKRMIRLHFKQNPECKIEYDLKFSNNN